MKPMKKLHLTLGKLLKYKKPNQKNMEKLKQVLIQSFETSF